MAEAPAGEFIGRVASRLAARRSAAPAAAEKTKAAGWGGYHQAAAVLSYFEAKSIRPVELADEENISQLLVDCSQVVEKNSPGKWTLLSEVRVAVLRDLRERDLVSKALAANPERGNDVTQKALEGYLTNLGKPLEEQSLAELSATYQTCGWLRLAGFSNLPEIPQITRRTDWLTLLLPFEHLAGENFRGRADELERLRDYVGVLPPGSLSSSVVRFLENVFTFTQKPPMLIFGPGGVGKSTLVARFILEHAKALESDRFPFVYLDFDRADVSSQEPATLLLEAVRQLGIEYPEARATCDSLGTAWRQVLARDQGLLNTRASGSPGFSPSQATLTTLIRDFSSLISSLGAADRPVLFVLDTFEEVQRRSQEDATAVWQFLELLQSSVGRLRVVLVGRGNLQDGRLTENMELKGFDEEAAIGYLQSRGVDDHGLARRLVRQVGGTPLSLKLAAELVEKEGVNRDGKLNLSTREFFLFRMDDALIQRQLYKRILDHIADPDVRKLAHPGLVLRRITPELISEVLAEPCGLQLNSPTGANALFEKLAREVSLVVVGSDGALCHRQDLRRLMLALVQADQPDKTRAIHTGAVSYYAGRQPGSATFRAEEIYHRLWLNEEIGTIDSRWYTGVEPHLSSALSEFSGARKAYLASRLGVDVDEETRAQAELEDWERLVGRKAVDLLSQNRFGEVLSQLGARAERTAGSELFGFEAQAYAGLQQWNESIEALWRGIESSQGQRSRTIALALQAAETALRSGRQELAERARNILENLEAGHLSAVEELEIRVRHIALLPRENLRSATGQELRKRLSMLADQVSDEEFRGSQNLALWVSALCGPADSRLLGRMLCISGLPRADGTAVRRLAAEITTIDVARSGQAGESPGLLARSMGVPVSGALTNSWVTFLLTAPDPVLRDVLVKLVESSGPNLDARLTDAFAAVMRAGLGIESSLEPPPKPQEEAEAPRRVSRTSGRVRETLRNALLRGFPSRDDLSEFLNYRLDRRLDAIASVNESLNVTLFTVIERAEAEGWLEELVTAARLAQPNNAALEGVAEQMGMTSFVNTSVSLIANVNQGSFEVGSWREGLAALEAQICRVEVGKESSTLGTGFLVGPDLLLTADFLLTSVYSGSVSANDVVLRFDCRTEKKRKTQGEGTVFRLERDWMVTRSPYGEGMDDLAFVLLRVKDSPGTQPIGGPSAESSAVLRRWIELPTSPPDLPSGSRLLLVGHPDGGALRLAMMSVGRSPDGSRLFYDGEAGPGTSGAPCFTPGFDPVVMHLASSRNGSKVGILLWKVVHQVERLGFGGLLGARFA